MNITQEEKEQHKVNLINEIVFLTNRLEDVWKYHPDNTQRIDPAKEYIEIQKQIASTETKISNLDK
jgi:hypothetical protein